MKQENTCQFYIIIGDKDFRPLNGRDVFINATGVMDFNLISAAIGREYRKKMVEENPVTVSNKIIFLVPNNRFYGICNEMVNKLGIMYYEIEFISEYKFKNDKSQNMDNVKKVETELKNEGNITASGSENIEVQKGIGSEKITISDNKAYVNSGLLSIDEQKFSLLQEWKKDPYMSSKLASLSAEEIDKMLIESVTKNLTTYRMESSREQNADDKAGEVAKEKAVMEDGLYNPELRIVRNNVSSPSKYSAVEVRSGNIQVVNPNVVGSTINSGGINNDFSNDRMAEGIMNEDIQVREDLGDYYLDDEGNVYSGDNTIIGKVGQNGIWVDHNTNTLVMNGRLMGYVDDYKNMGMSVEKNNKHVRVRKKEEKMNAAFVSLPVIMFVLSAMLLVGSIILLFVLK